MMEIFATPPELLAAWKRDCLRARATYTLAEQREELARLAREGDVTLPGAVSIARALIEDWYGGMLPDAQTLIT